MTNRTDPADREAPGEVDAAAGDAGFEAGGADADQLREELEQARAQHQRAVADYQNLERRSREERAEVGRLAMADAVRSFLPVLDDLDRAIESAEGEHGEAAWLQGIRLVAQKFRNVLQQHGVEEIHALGQPFDPNRHEAVGSAPGPEGQVVHLLQRGYLVRDRVLRPALVMVGSGEGTTPPPRPAGETGEGGDPSG